MSSTTYSTSPAASRSHDTTRPRMPLTRMPGPNSPKLTQMAMSMPMQMNVSATSWKVSPGLAWRPCHVATRTRADLPVALACSMFSRMQLLFRGQRRAAPRKTDCSAGGRRLSARPLRRSWSESRAGARVHSPRRIRWRNRTQRIALASARMLTLSARTSSKLERKQRLPSAAGPESSGASGAAGLPSRTGGSWPASPNVNLAKRPARGWSCALCATSDVS
mmetsp:Transcript_9258/g.31742  ORF Transcript_9258/g.31742 Transcript_9258/m.31742 type:complete len:221 (-) Transcript_9258:2134-2796(-)